MKLYKAVKLDRRSLVVDEPKYTLYYPKNAVVTADEKTIGILCFRLKEHAKDFLVWNGPGMIIEVESIGEVRSLSRVGSYFYIHDFYANVDIESFILQNKHHPFTAVAPLETVCCPTVHILT